MLISAYESKDRFSPLPFLHLISDLSEAQMEDGRREMQRISISLIHGSKPIESQFSRDNQACAHSLICTDMYIVDKEEEKSMCERVLEGLVQSQQ